MLGRRRAPPATVHPLHLNISCQRLECSQVHPQGARQRRCALPGITTGPLPRAVRGATAAPELDVTRRPAPPTFERRIRQPAGRGRRRRRLHSRSPLPEPTPHVTRPTLHPALHRTQDLTTVGDKAVLVAILTVCDKAPTADGRAVAATVRERARWRDSLRSAPPHAHRTPHASRMSTTWCSARPRAAALLAPVLLCACLLLVFLAAAENGWQNSCHSPPLLAAREMVASLSASEQPPHAEQRWGCDPPPGTAAVIVWTAAPEAPRLPPGLVFTDVLDAHNLRYNGTRQYNAGDAIWAEAARNLVDPDAVHFVSFFDVFDERRDPVTHLGTTSHALTSSAERCC